MWSCSRASLTFWAICSFLAAGCATTGIGARAPSAPGDSPPVEQADDPSEELPPPPGWPPYYPPQLLLEVSGTDEVTGNPTSFPRGYLFHRIDVEKVRVLKLHADRCDEDLADCEKKVAETTALPSFWNRTEGRILILAIGFVVGAGLTVGIVYAVGGGP
jgi:hypothetical protein